MMAFHFDSIVNAVVDEIRAGTDARVLAFTNDRVLAYNDAIHREIYGVQNGARFADGQRVIARQGRAAGVRCFRLPWQCRTCRRLVTTTPEGTLLCGVCYSGNSNAYL